MYEIDRGILAEARARIARDRKWDVQLKLAPPANVSLAGSKVTVTLTGHAFRFGCNGFGLTVLEDADLRQGTRNALTPCSTMPRCPFTGAHTRQPKASRAKTGCGGWRPGAGSTTSPPRDIRWSGTRSTPSGLLRCPTRRCSAWCGSGSATSSAAFAGRSTPGTWSTKRRSATALTTPSGATSAGQPSAAVEEMLRLAHDANPDAELLYNDFNVRDPSCDELVSDLVDGRAPMSAIGIQSHMHARTWPLQEAGRSASVCPLWAAPALYRADGAFGPSQGPR